MITAPQEIFLSKNMSVFKGISNVKSNSLRNLGIETVNDLLMHYPRSYEDRRNIKKISEIAIGENVTVIGKVVSYDAVQKRSNLTIITVVITDKTGNLMLTFFNQSFLKDILRVNKEFLFNGTIVLGYDGVKMEQPTYAPLSKREEFVAVLPVYNLTKGITNNLLRNLVKTALNIIKEIKDPMPEYVREKYGLISKDAALRNIHFPDNGDIRAKARYRLAFEELLELQILLHSIKQENINNNTGISFSPNKVTSGFIATLPFKLTNAQIRVWNEIEKDMAKEKVMNRLVIGDVGSGKTIIAILAMLNAIANGYQALYMAPTEILAEQHMKTVSKFLEPLGIKCALLTGSLPESKKKEIREGVKNGEINCVVGTHALIQKNVEYVNVGIVITDEQHRFGVRQRAALSAKGKSPDILVMTATPIPRTLALILYGDMDLSTIDELPAGRIPIKTYAVDSSMRKRIEEWTRKIVASGQQVYIVHPVVEESELENLLSATENYENLSNTAFKGIPTGLIHGKMSAKNKEEIMRQFVEGKIKILFSTTVIEVGVDVPNATLIIIENAERFGLSQLHQLRGRVGRNNMQSYCVMFTESKTDIVKERMNIMVKTNDGFKISEKDLEIRGPGELFGTQQHGIPEFKIANLYEDLNILSLAQDASFEIMQKIKEEDTKLYVRSVLKKAEGLMSML